MSCYTRNPDALTVTDEDIYSFKPFIFDVLETDCKTPSPRSGHRIACDEDNFYSFGGYNPANTDVDSDTLDEDIASLFRELWKFNFASGRWKKLEAKNIPFALASNAIILSGKVLLVFGGTGVPFHLERSNELFICNLAKEEVVFRKIETSGKPPLSLYGQAVFMKDNYFYAIGGTTGYDYFSDIHRLNLVTNTWEEYYISKGMKNDPPGRYRHELAVVGDKVFLLGGGIGSAAYAFDEIPVFDIVQKVWDVVRTIKDDNYGYPLPRQYHSSVNIPGTDSFVIIGGVLLGGRILDDVWKLDISTLSWTKMPSFQLFSPVYFHSSSVTPSGKLYTFGGVSKSIPSQRRISLIQAAWICIPKLKDISWEAVTYYGLVQNLTYSDFKQIGLPLEYYSKMS